MCWDDGNQTFENKEILKRKNNMQNIPQYGHNKYACPHCLTKIGFQEIMQYLKYINMNF